MKNNAPCFSVENNSETRVKTPQISVITVDKLNPDKLETMWLRELFSEPPRLLSPDNCISYGENGGGTELQKGDHYSVYMNASINGTSRKYRAYFCLSETPEGKTEIHHVKWNDAVKGYDWSVCEKNG